jgi:hypothetical protein
MIRRYDEIMSEKANKSAIKEIYEHMKGLAKEIKIKEVVKDFTAQVDSLKGAQE